LAPYNGAGAPFGGEVSDCDQVLAVDGRPVLREDTVDVMCAEHPPAPDDAGRVR
jgi:hypothetical protein